MKTAITKSTSGFTLVEVTLALGIFAFALVAMIGLLPVAMKSTRESIDIAAATQIANQIVATYVQEDFALSGSEIIYFDDYGAIYEGNGDGWLYRADVALGTVAFEEESQILTENLARLSVEVSSLRNPQNPHRFSFLLVNDGR